MISVSNIFGCISGNNGVTEEIIYENILSSEEKYEVLSSSIKKETKLGFLPKIEISNKEINVFENGIGILIARNGNAGYMTLLKSKSKYTTNDHAYIIFIKNEFLSEYKLNEIEFLKWFIIKHQNTIFNYSTKNDNSTWNKTTFFRDCNIEIPTKKEIKNYSILFDKKEKLTSIIQIFKEKIELISNKSLVIDSQNFKEIKIDKILSYISRNDILSEEGLYNIKKNKTNNIKVLSGSIDNIFYGEIPKETERIHYLKNRQGLHLITRGKAGKLTYLERGFYATNTNAFILYLRDDIKSEINVNSDSDEECYLKFLKIFLQPTFFEISSNSDVSVFPLTKVFNNMEIPKFIFNDEIKNIVEKFNTIDNLSSKVDNLQQQLNKIIEKEIL